MLERIFNLSGAFDLRRPEPHNDYGIHHMEMRFAVKGSKGGVSAKIGTAWYLPQNQQASLAMYTKGYPFNPCEELMQPKFWSLDQHHKAPMYEDQTPVSDCELTGGKCYCDGTSLWGQEAWLPGFLHGGSDWRFSRLEEYYHHIFENGPEPNLTPVPRKHPKES